MDNKVTNLDEQVEIPEAAFHSPISNLDVSKHITKLLDDNGYHHVGDIIQQLVDEKEVLLAIRGIGPKILEQIEIAIENFEPEVQDTSPVVYPPPVPTLADYFRSRGGLALEETVEKESDKGDTDQTISYNPPVPSLGDYFDPENMVVVVHTLTAEETKAFEKQTKAQSKPKKDKKSKKAEKPKTKRKKKARKPKNKQDKKGKKDKKEKKDKKNKKKNTKKKKTIKTKNKKKSKKK